METKGKPVSDIMSEIPHGIGKMPQSVGQMRIKVSKFRIFCGH